MTSYVESGSGVSDVSVMSTSSDVKMTSTIEASDSSTPSTGYGNGLTTPSAATDVTPLSTTVTPATSPTVTQSITGTPPTQLPIEIIGGAAAAGVSFVLMLALLFCACLICYVRVRRRTPYKLKEGDTGIVVLRKQVADVYVYSYR